MFSANILTITVLSSLFGLLVFQFIEDKFNVKNNNIFIQGILWILLIFSLYNFLGGLSMIFDWENPLSEISPEQQGRVAGRRRGGLVLLIIQFWPYALTVIGAGYSILYYGLIKDRSTKK